MNIAKMLKQAQQMQSQLAETQSKLAEKTVEASSGGGKVTVTANGAGDVTAIRIDPAIVSVGDVEMLEDLVLVAVKQAIANAKKMAGDEMGKITSGLNIPGLPF
ncbi:MAG TPA: YbaB/EbfC family nucleoid-associated protein [Chthoniobacterales bacterium]